MREEIIDVAMQQPNELFMSQPWFNPRLRWRSGLPATPTVSATIEAMDEAGVRFGLLSAAYAPSGPLISNDEVAEVVSAHPDRFGGVASVDLSDPVRAVREIRHRVRDQGFVGVRIRPWLWKLPPNDRRYYPVYVTCVEEDVPFCTQIGRTRTLHPSEPGRPIPYLDEVLLDFPELVVVGGHVGYPWVPEVLTLADKYPNFFVDTGGYAAHRLPPELVEFMRGHGRDRVLFGSNHPMLTAQTCLKRLGDLQLGAEARELFLSGTARRVFSLPV